MSTSDKQVKNIFNILFGALNIQIWGVKNKILRPRVNHIKNWGCTVR